MTPRIAVLLAWTLSACAPETAPAPPSSTKTATSTKVETQTVAMNMGTSATNVPPARMEAPMRAPVSTGNPMSMTAMQLPASSSGAAGTPAKIPTDAGMPKMMTAKDAGMPNASNADCMKLSSCCMGLTDNGDRRDCEQAVERNDAMRCARASTELCQAPTMPGMPSESCMKLSSCCETFTRDLQKRECQQTVMRADDERCTRQLERGCPEMLPPPSEPACATLHDCCAKLMEPQLDLCRRALADGDKRDCERASMQLCQ